MESIFVNLSMFENPKPNKQVKMGFYFLSITTIMHVKKIKS